MGYESKFYAVKKYDFKATKDLKYDASEIIATLDVSKMGYSDNVNKFLSLFDKEAPFMLWIDGYDSEKEAEVMVYTHEDRYGEPITYITDKKKGIKLLKEIIKEDDYWRFDLLLRFMKAFKDHDDVYICHYGH